MDDRTAPLPRNSSRTLAKVAVAALVVIAIAGIVLASLRGRVSSPAGTPAVPDATQPAAGPMTTTPPDIAKAEAEAGPNQVVFAPDSDEISEPGMVKLIRFAEDSIKVNRGMIVINAKVEAGSKALELTQKRAFAVRSVLVSHKLPLGNLQVRVEEVPLGTVPPAEANRVGFSVP